MGVNRREFLKISGLSTLMGLGGKATMDLLAPGQLDAQEVIPKPGALKAKRWAMVVDMKNCLEKVAKDGCKDCMDICHQVHNVPHIASHKEEIKWLWQTSYEHAFPSQGHVFSEDGLKGKPFLMLCNHCDKPPCVRVCPTKATFKREDGIVLMDFHRCIGCRFCMAACPYGSRSFNWRDPRQYLKDENPDFPTRTKGVVEKCNFCAERLADGLMPACVDVCKVKALTFGDLEDGESDVRKVLRSNYSIRRKPELGTKPEVYYIV